jgi:hypothetical protein
MAAVITESVGGPDPTAGSSEKLLTAARVVAVAAARRASAPA